jgi:lipoprotein-anchoring transpeptidase ErfK/SrfK
VTARGGAALIGLLAAAGAGTAAGCGGDGPRSGAPPGAQAPPAQAPPSTDAPPETGSPPAAAPPPARTAPPASREERARSRPNGERIAAQVVRPTALRAGPGGRIVARLRTRTGYGSPTTMLVARSRGTWLGVVAAERSNGRLGWIAAHDARLLRETWALEVDLSRRRLVVRHQGRVAASFRVAVGAPGTTTPKGIYGVTDRLRTGDPVSPYGCCILALTGHQPHVAQGWTGGDRIAIHGTSSLGSIGTAATHGCVRAGTAGMRFLMARIPLGAPVTVRA